MRNNSGYSLIELVIVIVVIGILSVAAIPKFMQRAENLHGVVCGLLQLSAAR